MLKSVFIEKRAPRKKPRLTEGKKNIIQSLIEEYDIETAEDIQAALKDLLGGTIENMLQAELNHHLGYEAYEHSDEENYRNGLKPKKLRISYGEIDINIPQDRNGSFEPKIIPKRKKIFHKLKVKS